jgi:hypothetical protein
MREEDEAEDRPAGEDARAGPDHGCARARRRGVGRRFRLMIARFPRDVKNRDMKRPETEKKRAVGAVPFVAALGGQDKGRPGPLSPLASRSAMVRAISRRSSGVITTEVRSRLWAWAGRSRRCRPGPGASRPDRPDRSSRWTRSAGCPRRPAAVIRSGPALMAEPCRWLPTSCGAKSMHGGKGALVRQRLERAAAHAGGVKDRHLEPARLERRFQRDHVAQHGLAEAGHADQRPVAGGLFDRPRGAQHGAGGLAERRPCRSS